MRSVWGLLVVASLVWAFPAVAYADDVDDLCGDQPGCTVEGFDDGGSGIPGWFGFLFVLVLVAGILMAVYRFNFVRATARKAGLDPDEATTMALLDDDGVSTTYLAANLRPREAPASTPRRSTSERLQELEQLKAAGQVTEQEYAERRARILDSL